MLSGKVSGSQNFGGGAQTECSVEFIKHVAITSKTSDATSPPPSFAVRLPHPHPLPHRTSYSPRCVCVCVQYCTWKYVPGAIAQPTRKKKSVPCHHNQITDTACTYCYYATRPPHDDDGENAFRGEKSKEVGWYPTTNGGMQEWKLSRNIHTRCMPHFCTFGTDLHAQLVLVNKISASELSPKFIKSALLVG